jgi:hypothetical protein
MKLRQHSAVCLRLVCQVNAVCRMLFNQCPALFVMGKTAERPFLTPFTNRQKRGVTKGVHVYIVTALYETVTTSPIDEAKATQVRLSLSRRCCIIVLWQTPNTHL